jgi:hypothetical protein
MQHSDLLMSEREAIRRDCSRRVPLIAILGLIIFFLAVKTAGNTAAEPHCLVLAAWRSKLGHTTDYAGT